MLLRCCLLVVSALVLLILPVDAAPIFHVTAVLDLLPGSTSTVGVDLNNRAWITGVVEGSGSRRAFLFQNGVLRDLQAPGDASGVAINAFGHVAGHTLLSPGIRSWLYNGSTFADVGDFSATSMNNADQIVGFKDGRALLWTDGQITDIGGLPGASDNYAAGINDSGHIVGQSGGQAFLYANGQFSPLGTLGGDISIALAINNAGQITGQSETESGQLHAFLWEQGRMIDLDTSGGNQSVGLDINQAGDVVGFYKPGSGARAVLFSDGMLYDLNSVLDESGAGWLLLDASAINDLGQILVHGVHPSIGGRTLLLSPGTSPPTPPPPDPGTLIPEPRSITLALIGLVFIWNVRHRRKWNVRHRRKAETA